MGPTQSAVAWPGCAEDKANFQEGFPNKQGESRQAMTAPQDTTHTFDQHLVSKQQQSQHFDPEPDDSHQVSVNPVYEFALCRKIKETFRRGDTSEVNSQADVEHPPPASVSEDDSCVAASVVSVQPQSLASSHDSPLDSRPSHYPAQSGQMSAECGGDQSDQQASVGNDPGPKTPSHELNSLENTTNNVEESCSDPMQTSELIPSQTQLKPHATNLPEDRTETVKINQKPEHNESTETVPNKDLTLTTEKLPAPTESKATQTTQPHPADISLSPPPPPRPVMISVSTPPDETSPMFYKLSQVGSYLTDDIPSSPDVESDTSEAGYAHLRGRFGSAGSQDGGAAAAGAAAGASDSSPRDTGRRKRSKKKEEKSVDYVLRALSNLGSPQEKLTAMCKKYTELHDDQRGLHALLKQHQRKLNMVQREKDHLQLEHNKAVMSKSKLESLCRELQKQNKVVKDESLLRLKEEEERRKQMSAKFQTSLSEIQAQVNENHEQNLKLRGENQELSSRLKTFLEQHQVREQQLDQLSHHRHLELQLAETRLQHAAAVLREEQEVHLKEKEKILRHATEGEQKYAILEVELDKYKTRYEEFQDTISKSSQVFQRLKSDMDRMGSRIKKLEKEGEQWKHKWETSNKALEDVTQEKSSSDKEKQTLQNKVTKLESLCRALQGQLREACKTNSNSLQFSDDASAEHSTQPSSSASVTASCSPDDLSSQDTASS